MKGDHPEPMIPMDTPQRPWQLVGTDLIERKGNAYLLVVDYLSRFPEIARLESTTARAVVEHMKSVFSRHGIPEVARSDNGPQYASEVFKTFAKEYRFSHITSSPLYPQSNGQAERMVKTVKCLLEKASDPYIALLAYRTSPLSNG